MALDPPLRIGERSVRTLIKAKKLKAAKVGGRGTVIVHEVWVSEYADSCVTRCL